MRKRNINIQVAVTAIMMTLAVRAGAVTRYVSSGQSIQTAINASSNGDEIEVAPGTYNEAINFFGKAVRLYSRDGPDVTTIDANGIAGAYHVVQCVNAEDANTILEGFTITGGNANGRDSRNVGRGGATAHPIWRMRAHSNLGWSTQISGFESSSRAAIAMMQTADLRNRDHLSFRWVLHSTWNRCITFKRKMSA